MKVPRNTTTGQWISRAEAKSLDPRDVVWEDVGKVRDLVRERDELRAELEALRDSHEALVRDLLAILDGKGGER